MVDGEALLAMPAKADGVSSSIDKLSAHREEGGTRETLFSSENP
jgi:hypothetical protein